MRRYRAFLVLMLLISIGTLAGPATAEARSGDNDSQALYKLSDQFSSKWDGSHYDGYSKYQKGDWSHSKDGRKKDRGDKRKWCKKDEPPTSTTSTTVPSSTPSSAPSSTTSSTSPSTTSTTVGSPTTTVPPSTSTTVEVPSTTLPVPPVAAPPAVVAMSDCDGVWVQATGETGSVAIIVMVASAPVDGDLLAGFAYPVLVQTDRSWTKVADYTSGGKWRVVLDEESNTLVGSGFFPNDCVPDESTSISLPPPPTTFPPDEVLPGPTISEELPHTGIDSGVGALVALACVVSGLALLGLTRRMADEDRPLGRS